MLLGSIANKSSLHLLLAILPLDIESRNGKLSVLFLFLQYFFPPLWKHVRSRKHKTTSLLWRHDLCANPPPPFSRLGPSQSMVSDVIARAELLSRPRLAFCSRRRAVAVFGRNLALHVRVSLVWLGFNMQEGPCIPLWFYLFVSLTPPLVRWGDTYSQRKGRSEFIWIWRTCFFDVVWCQYGACLFRGYFGLKFAVITSSDVRL